ncbi:MAG: DNA mismatch repair protein MutS [Clostridia bacterium]|nr:DNA mismatch repair protein MutS [Clostridia bacterium]
MMRHYFEIKEKYNDCILMYRLGDFYEMFFSDAEVVSKELELTLTGRDCGLKERAPMCGVPYHAVDVYISRLINRGYKVAICEQLTNPGDQKGMVERDVVRVITAGTVVEDAILDDKKNNYVAAVFHDGKNIGLAWAELSTGEFNLVEYSGDNSLKQAENTLNSIHAAEILGNVTAKNIFAEDALYRIPVSVYPDWAFVFKTAEKTLKEQFAVVTLDAYECGDKKYAVSAAGALMQYLKETQKRSLSQFSKLNYLKSDEIMFLDATTRRNLELSETIRDRRKTGTLLWLLDKTQTSMGARKLRKWVDNPLVSESKINARLNALTELISNVKLRKNLLKALEGMRDLERLAGKVAFGSLNPRECYGIGSCLVLLPVLKETLKDATSPMLKGIRSKIGDFDKICDIIARAIIPDPPYIISEGGFIADGFDRDVDEYNLAEREASDWIKQMETEEREKTGIRTLRIGCNKVFGYYIEVSKSFKDQVPLEYERKQTTVNGERYKTEALSDLEERITGAHDKRIKREIALFDVIRKMLGEVVPAMLSTADAVSALDCLLSLAIVSIENDYVCPKINGKVREYKIVCGRHPVVEKLLDKGKYIPNDAVFSEECRTMVITGPNMAGKSTYMRMVALIVLMAHIGCYVPANSAEIKLTDRIFTRVGASDDLSNALSTFMVEMVEVANILNNASDKSLLILDEIGRGTSTCDGLSIAWSVLEYCNKVLKCNTLFATHYHELTDLEGKMFGVKNYRIMVSETGGTVVFLHKIARGGTNKSYGIEVAGLAGVPKAVTDRAKSISEAISYRENINTDAILSESMGEKTQVQMDLFQAGIQEELYNILKETNVENMTPMQALVTLADLVERAKK